MTTTVTSDHYPTQSCTERAWVVYCVFLVNFWAYLIEQPHTGASEIQRHVRSVLLRYKKLSTETSGRWRRHTNATSLESSLWSLGAPRCNLAEKNEKQSKNRRKVSEMKTNQIFINIRMIIVILINQGWSTALSARLATGRQRNRPHNNKKHDTTWPSRDRGACGPMRARPSLPGRRVGVASVSARAPAERPRPPACVGSRARCPGHGRPSRRMEGSGQRDQVDYGIVLESK